MAYEETSGVRPLERPLSDEEVVGRVRAGETSMYEVLVRRHHKRLCLLARKVLRDDAEAEDVAQEVHLRVLTHLDQYAGRASFLTWLTKIALNEALGRLRKRPRQPIEDITPVTLDRTEYPLASRSANPEQQAINAEMRWLLWGAVKVLPEVYRNVFIMRELRGMTTAEAAEHLGLTDVCVKTRLHRARTLLRRRLPEPARTPWRLSAQPC